MPDVRRIDFDWALAGALAAAEHRIGIAVVVDVLSFSTAVSVGCDRDAAVFPFTWQDDRATDYARAVGAELAGPRREPGVSLSPASIRAAKELTGLVLPSPNGSTISFALRDKQVSVVAGCLRNAVAVGRYLAAQDGPIVVIAAGERWPDDSLRPAAEDLWGAGAILHSLAEARGVDGFTVEARTAVAAFEEVSTDLHRALSDCVSGRELIERGYRSDVDIAAEYAASDRVPRLSDGAFRSV